jgi:hypothetical protein
VFVTSKSMSVLTKLASWVLGPCEHCRSRRTIGVEPGSDRLHRNRRGSGSRWIEVSVMRSKTIRVAVIAMATVGLFAACSDDESSNEFPVGVYHEPGSTDAGGSMEFKSDGTFVLAYGDEIVTDGTYSIDGDQLTWETDSWCKNISADAESATYTWTEEGDLLTMTVEGEDLCIDRVNTIQSGFERSDG